MNVPNVTALHTENQQRCEIFNHNIFNHNNNDTTTTNNNNKVQNSLERQGGAGALWEGMNCLKVVSTK